VVNATPVVDLSVVGIVTVMVSPGNNAGEGRNVTVALDTEIEPGTWLRWSLVKEILDVVVASTFALKVSTTACATGTPTALRAGMEFVNKNWPEALVARQSKTATRAALETTDCTMVGIKVNKNKELI
jgi:hypothetical protein